MSCHRVTKGLQALSLEFSRFKEFVLVDKIAQKYQSKGRLQEILLDLDSIPEVNRDQVKLRAEIAKKFDFNYVGPIHREKICFGYMAYNNMLNQDKQVYLVDVERPEKLAGPYMYVSDFSELGYALACVDEENFELIDRSGQVVSRPNLHPKKDLYLTPQCRDERDKFPLMLYLGTRHTTRGEYCYMGHDGQLLAKGKRFISRFAEGMAIAQMSKSRFAIYNEKGKKNADVSNTAGEPFFGATQFQGGLALAAAKSVDGNHNCLFKVFSDGQVENMGYFSSALKSFGEGLWMLKDDLNESYLFTDFAGQTLGVEEINKSNETNFTRIVYAKPFKDGGAVVKLGNNTMEEMEFLIDRNGKFFFKEGLKEIIAGEGDGIIVIKDNSDRPFKFVDLKKGFLTDEQGKVLAYRSAKPFYQGRAVVTVNGRLGIIDQYGHEIVPPEYYEIGNYENGVALAKKGNDSFYLDRRGRQVFAKSNTERFKRLTKK